MPKKGKDCCIESGFLLSRCRQGASWEESLLLKISEPSLSGPFLKEKQQASLDLSFGQTAPSALQMSRRNLFIVKESLKTGMKISVPMSAFDLNRQIQTEDQQ